MNFFHNNKRETKEGEREFFDSTKKLAFLFATPFSLACLHSFLNDVDLFYTLALFSMFPSL